MSHMRCPGQDRGRWRPEDVVELECAGCGEMIEFWPDIFLRKCPGCGRRASNPNFNMGCLEWCRFAEKCIDTMRGAREEAAAPIREELAESIRAIFGPDQRRIEHAERVLALAEQIGRLEGADPLVIVPATLLHDIGLAGVEPDSRSPAAQAHGATGAERARAMLQELSFPESVAREVVDIIAGHHDRDAMGGPNARVIWDADLIVNLAALPREDALARLRAEALTDAGRSVGESRLRG